MAEFTEKCKCHLKSCLLSLTVTEMPIKTALLPFYPNHIGPSPKIWQNTLSTGVWRNEHAHTLPVGVSQGSSSQGGDLAISNKITFTPWPRNPITGNWPCKYACIIVKQSMHKLSYCGILSYNTVNIQCDIHFRCTTPWCDNSIHYSVPGTVSVVTICHCTLWHCYWLRSLCCAFHLCGIIFNSEDWTDMEGRPVKDSLNKGRYSFIMKHYRVVLKTGKMSTYWYRGDFALKNVQSM